MTAPISEQIRPAIETACEKIKFKAGTLRLRRIALDLSDIRPFIEDAVRAAQAWERTAWIDASKTNADIETVLDQIDALADGPGLQHVRLTKMTLAGWAQDIRRALLPSTSPENIASAEPEPVKTRDANIESAMATFGRLCDEHVSSSSSSLARKKFTVAVASLIEKAIEVDRSTRKTEAGALDSVFEHVRHMMHNGFFHKTKGYKLGEMKGKDQWEHLLEEIKELDEATTMQQCREELADVLGVIFHMAIYSGDTPQALATRLLDKLRERFDCHVKVAEPIFNTQKFITDFDMQIKADPIFTRLIDIRDNDQLDQLILAIDRRKAETHVKKPTDYAQPEKATGNLPGSVYQFAPTVQVLYGDGATRLPPGCYIECDDAARGQLRIVTSRGESFAMPGRRYMLADCIFSDGISARATAPTQPVGPPG